MKTFGRTALAAVALVMLVAACGDDAAGGPGETITVGAIDYAFVDLPETIKAGTEIQLDNRSDNELHEFVAVLLPEDEDRSVEELVELPMEELAALFPNVETVVIAPPGESGIVVEGDGVLDTPGRYAIVCVIPTGADPQAYLEGAQESEGGPPDVEGGPPHFVNGMYAEVEVVE